MWRGILRFERDGSFRRSNSIVGIRLQPPNPEF
jgi:hypothetical protein